MRDTSKSKRINSIEDGKTIETGMNANRWARAFKDYAPEYNDHGEVNEYADIYIFQAGNQMMPADYHEEHDTLKELEHSIRNFADLRKWR